MNVLAVVPAYNEAATVGTVVEQLRRLHLPVVVVDDGSTDETARVARRAGAVVLSLPVNVGVGGALRTGFAYAVKKGFGRVVQVDGDLQHDPDEVPKLLAEADATGADLVIGSRFEGEGYPMSGTRALVLRMLAGLVSSMTGLQLTDVTSGFRVITSPLLEQFAIEYPAEYLGDTVEAILAAHAAGFRIGQVPVKMSARPAGSATSGLTAAGHTARMLLAVLLRRRPLGRMPS